MSVDKIKPTRTDLQSNNNMLGAAIEAVLNYCEVRKEKNPQEKCALIGYESSAELIFKDKKVSDLEIIKEECIRKLKPKTTTYFLNAFKEAEPIINSVKKGTDYIPIIILLTDGLDMAHQKTCDYIQDEVS